MVSAYFKSSTLRSFSQNGTADSETVIQDEHHSCKSESQIEQDLADIEGYQVIRLYATDCNQVANVIKATKGSVSIFAGIADIKDIENDIATLASAVNGNWTLINTVSVGNELVNANKASADQYVFPRYFTPLFLPSSRLQMHGLRIHALESHS